MAQHYPVLMPTLGTIDKRPQLGEVEVEWKIPNFFSLPRKVDQFDVSPEFSFSGGTWCLVAYLNGVRKYTPEGFIDLYLFMKRHSKPAPALRVAFEFFLNTAYGTKEKLCELKVLFNRVNNVWGGIKVVRRSRLFDERNELVPSGVLTIICSMKSKDLHVVRRLEKLSEDLNKMSLSGDASDLTFIVEGQVFRLHKSILSARAPVFFATMQRYTRKKRMGTIRINECDANTFRQFVDYVYSGTVGELTERNVFLLYEIADKYQLVELKEDCAVFLESLLSADTLPDIFTLAMRCSDTRLILVASKFFSRSMKEVIKTKKWQEYMKENFDMAKELIASAVHIDKKKTAK